MKVDFTQIVLTGIDREPIKVGTPIYKTIAERIFYKIGNLDLVETARKINEGKPVELSPTDIKQIKACVLASDSGLFAFARKEIEDFFDNLKEADAD